MKEFAIEVWNCLYKEIGAAAAVLLAFVSFGFGMSPTAYNDVRQVIDLGIIGWILSPFIACLIISIIVVYLRRRGKINSPHIAKFFMSILFLLIAILILVFLGGKIKTFLALVFVQTSLSLIIIYIIFTKNWIDAIILNVQNKSILRALIIIAPGCITWFIFRFESTDYILSRRDKQHTNSNEEINWSGYWITAEPRPSRNSTGVIHFTDYGDSISGSYLSSEGEQCILSGFKKDSILRGTWINTCKSSRGMFQFKLDKGRSFTGKTINDHALSSWWDGTACNDLDKISATYKGIGCCKQNDIGAPDSMRRPIQSGHILIAKYFKDECVFYNHDDIKNLRSSDLLKMKSSSIKIKWLSRVFGKEVTAQNYDRLASFKTIAENSKVTIVSIYHFSKDNYDYYYAKVTY